MQIAIIMPKKYKVRTTIMSQLYAELTDKAFAGFNNIDFVKNVKGCEIKSVKC